MGKPLISKKEFVEIIHFIQNKTKAEDKLNEALSEFAPESGYLFLCADYETRIVELLEKIMKDDEVIPHVGSNISYFIYELNFGEKWKKDSVTDKDGKSIDISTASKLYEYLVKENFKKE